MADIKQFAEDLIKLVQSDVDSMVKYAEDSRDSTILRFMLGYNKTLKSDNGSK